MKKNGIRHVKVAPYHPASNGLAKRAVRTFKEGYEKMEEESVLTKISRFLLSYRTTPHSTTENSPAQLLMRRKLHTQLDRILVSIADRLKDKQREQTTAYDYHAKERKIQEGQAVCVKDFPAKKTWSPGRVVTKTAFVSAQVKLENGTIVPRHQDHIQSREQKVSMPAAKSDIVAEVSVVLPEFATAAPTPEFCDSPETPSHHQQFLWRNLFWVALRGHAQWRNLLRPVLRGHAQCGKG